MPPTVGLGLANRIAWRATTAARSIGISPGGGAALPASSRALAASTAGSITGACSASWLCRGSGPARPPRRLRLAAAVAAPEAAPAPPAPGPPGLAYIGQKGLKPRGGLSSQDCRTKPQSMSARDPGSATPAPPVPAGASPAAGPDATPGAPPALSFAWGARPDTARFPDGGRVVEEVRVSISGAPEQPSRAERALFVAGGAPAPPTVRAQQMLERTRPDLQAGDFYTLDTAVDDEAAKPAAACEDEFGPAAADAARDHVAEKRAQAQLTAPQAQSPAHGPDSPDAQKAEFIAFIADVCIVSKTDDELTKLMAECTDEISVAVAACDLLAGKRAKAKLLACKYQREFEFGTSSPLCGDHSCADESHNLAECMERAKKECKFGDDDGALHTGTCLLFDVLKCRLNFQGQCGDEAMFDEMLSLEDRIAKERDVAKTDGRFYHLCPVLLVILARMFQFHSDKLAKDSSLCAGRLK